MLLIRLKQQPMSLPLLKCYHSAIVQGRHSLTSLFVQSSVIIF